MAATWFVYLSNGLETHALPQPSRVAAEEAARLCRLAAPSVKVAVVCVPGRDEDGG